MSKIEELIKHYCPNGVAFDTIENLCKISRGRVMSKEYLRDNAGDYPVYSSQTLNDGMLGKINTFDYDGEYLTWTTDGANAGSIFYRTGKFSITNVCGLLKVKVNHMNPKFLHYYLGTIAKGYVNEGMGNPKLMSNVMAKIKVAVPPLPVQEEIVKVLDTFTELGKELGKELEKRKQQYEYYRNKLLTPENMNSDVKYFTIEEAFNMKNGYTPSKNNSSFWENGTIPWFRMEDIRENGRILNDSLLHITQQAVKGNKLFPANSIIVATSATIGEHCLITVPFLANQRFFCLSPKKENIFNMKYIFYYMFIVDEWCKENTTISSFASVDMAKFKKLKIPVPSLAEQERIVEILDKFDSLINDISEGLPAEINARKQQYEHYRNKLLTFDEVI